MGTKAIRSVFALAKGISFMGTPFLKNDPIIRIVKDGFYKTTLIFTKADLAGLMALPSEPYYTDEEKAKIKEKSEKTRRGRVILKTFVEEVDNLLAWKPGHLVGTVGLGHPIKKWTGATYFCAYGAGDKSLRFDLNDAKISIATNNVVRLGGVNPGVYVPPDVRTTNIVIGLDDPDAIEKTVAEIKSFFGL